MSVIVNGRFKIDLFKIIFSNKCRFTVDKSVPTYEITFDKLKCSYPGNISGKFKVTFGFINATGLSTHGPGLNFQALENSGKTHSRKVGRMQYSPQSEYMYVYGPKEKILMLG